MILRTNIRAAPIQGRPGAIKTIWRYLTAILFFWLRDFFSSDFSWIWFPSSCFSINVRFVFLHFFYVHLVSTILDLIMNFPLSSFSDHMVFISLDFLMITWFPLSLFFLDHGALRLISGFWTFPVIFLNRSVTYWMKIKLPPIFREE